MSLTIATLTDADRTDWERLARGYKAFYNTPTIDAEYERAWQRLCAGDEVFGLAAHADGKLVGIAHYLFHTVVWAPKVCYLQDLFTDADARGKGVGRALIEAVAARAKSEGAVRYYWMTQEHNATARALYDKVAKYHGFMRYEFDMVGKS